jgi:hypothetical protein
LKEILMPSIPRQSRHTLLVAATAAFLVIAARAQTSAHGHWVYDPNGVATAAFVYDVPPEGFNALALSDVDLQQWGYPPRPRTGDAKSYIRWKRLVGLARISPQLTFTNVYNGPARNVRIGSPASRSTSASSDNWSGSVITQPNGTFTAEYSTVYGEWTVPAVAPAPGLSCSSATYASSQSVGFDGWDAADVLQAGTSANCSSYNAWYEWYPNAETVVSLPVSPGDNVGVEVWYTTSSPYGHTTLTNNITGKTVTVGFNPPSGTTYLGNSVEWIMERPEVGTALADLPNYFFAYLAGNASTCTGGSICSPTIVPSGATLYQVNMTCPPWTPSSACTGTTTITYSYAVGDNTLAVYTEPPAR